jgi:hypothetical protein
MWQANPDLIHKAFLYDETTRRGGGLYLWKNIEAAKQAHGPAFQEAIQSIFGSKPELPFSKRRSLSITTRKRFSTTYNERPRGPVVNARPCYVLRLGR